MSVGLQGDRNLADTSDAPMLDCAGLVPTLSSRGCLTPWYPGEGASRLLCFAAVCWVQTRLGTRSYVRKIYYRACMTRLTSWNIKKLSQIEIVCSALICYKPSLFEQVARVLHYFHTFLTMGINFWKERYQTSWKTWCRPLSPWRECLDIQAVGAHWEFMMIKSCLLYVVKYLNEVL